MIARQKPELRILGREFIPAHSPCVITFNHYHRPGFQAWWLALGVAAVVKEEMHWVITSELTFPGNWYAFVGRPLSRWVLRKMAHTYTFTGMPPMPPRPQDAGARAVAVRQVLSYIKYTENPMLGLAPEGGDNPDGIVCMPAPGLGRFGLLLAGAGLSIVPVGAYESDGSFCLRFGPKYELKVPAGLSARQKDLQAARIIMQNIANLLPTSLRGDFE
ncbi:MAG: hypothetical protein A2X25_10200 [Chloroflexi bacterium GWB2_49_20]|nr:MAG: hypothetical protein A2X25_10200 [Chloroflexi bacterium GWB2_49_20]OGN79211.1 MAG: hypothetical protein A2X26_03820 [Chloroflexi bacterium GWC2_49_37]OGN83019.1 MAG: hypothetical protein A2X27_08875 [Chloroflexi bacterium GWD2_49_16]HCC78679.1 hypothetical protein [Anaerolineae bacterium]